MALDRARSLLLVVDMQARLQPAIAAGDAVLREVLRLMRVARTLAVPVLATEHCAEAIGDTLGEVATLADRVVAKTHFDACAEPGFLDALPPGRPDILLCGTEAHVCVLQTALGLRAAAAGCWWPATPSAAGGPRTSPPRWTACGRAGSNPSRWRWRPSNGSATRAIRVSATCSAW
nr:isochorismatase family protein [Paracraurococcus ruber]